MTTRAEHLQWCKDRALGELKAPGRSFEQAKALAVASMTSDLLKWDDGVMYDPMMIVAMTMECTYRTTIADMEKWIKGFN